MHKWTNIDGNSTYRMEVPGGWLYRYGNDAMVFVPTPNYSANISYATSNTSSGAPAHVH